MNDFLIEIQAKLDEAKSKGNINSDIDKIQNQLNKLKLQVEIDPKSISNIVKQLEQILNQKINIPNIGINSNQSNDSGKQIGQSIGQNIANGVSSSNGKISNEIQKIINKVRNIKISIGENGDISTKINVLRNNFTKLGLSADDVKLKMNSVDHELLQLKSAISSGNNDLIIAQFEKLKLALSQTQNNLKTLRSEYSLLATDQQRLSKANAIEAWNQKNSRATREVIEQNNSYIASLRDLNTQMTKVQFNKIVDGFKRSENAMRGINKLGSTIKQQFSQAAQSFSQWLSVSAAVMFLISKTKEAIQELKEMDTLLTEISKANDKLSKDELKEIGNNSFDTASKYGKKSTDYLSGVQEASRAGYTNAEGIAELSVAAQGAGDMTADIANQMIIATDKAYKLGGSIESLKAVLDGMNYITNNNAVNMTELSEAMSITGSTAASFGVDVNETVAAIGTMAATTQQSGSEVARAFKAILLNIRQVSDADEGIDAEGLTKYEKACNALGVKLKETKDGVLSLRDPMTVLKELSIAYNKLDESDIRRTNLLSSVGGKLRATQLDALLRQWDTYETMLKQYEDGTGSMAVEAEKTSKSWEGSLNRLSNTWADTVKNIADSDAIIAAINSLNALLSVINKLTESIGPIGTIGLGVGLFKGLKTVGRNKNVFPICFEIADNNMCSLGY